MSNPYSRHRGAFDRDDARLAYQQARQAQADGLVNTEHAYHEAGYKAGKAMRQGDAGMYDFQKRWFNRALDLEKHEHQAQARELWARGYCEAQASR